MFASLGVLKKSLHFHSHVYNRIPLVVTFQMVFDLNENYLEMFPYWPIQGVITAKVSLRSL